MDEPTCHEEHEEIKEELLSIEKTLEFHVAETHAKLLPAEKILTRDEVLDADLQLQNTLDEFAADSKADRLEIHRQMEEMAEVVLGKPHTNIDGMISRSGGMKAMVHDNENGGLRFKWAKEIMAAVVAIIIALVGLATTVVTHQNDSDDSNQEVIDQVEENTKTLDTILDELGQHAENPTTPITIP